MNEPAKILVRATNWVGDAVMSLPALRALHDCFPKAEITILARPWVAELYAGETSVRRVIPYTARSGWRDLPAKWKAARALRAERFDLAILFQNAFEAAAIARLAGIPRIIGYDRDGRGPLLTDRISVPRPGDVPEHERFYYLELLRRSGLIRDLPDSTEIRLEGAAQAAEAGRERFAAMGLRLPIIGVSPGAAYGNAKRYLPERFAEAVIALAKPLGASICLFGTASERALCERVKSLIPTEPVRNLAGETSLRGFIECAAACDLFLTNDSGSMHIVSALGVPSVTVFGSTNPVTTGPTGELARIVREPVSCSPCLLRECPIDHRCMTGIPASRLVDAALAILPASRRHEMPQEIERMDTRQKILNPENAISLAAKLRREGWKVKLISGYFDVLQPAIIRSIADAAEPGAKLFVLVSNPALPVMPSIARAELAASLRLIDYVVRTPENAKDFLVRFAPDTWLDQEQVHVRSTERLIQHVLERHDRAVARGARH